ncbi:glucosamine-6-phosphate deaminase [Magnetospirillum sp. 15-1]|uniref:glucosamine-6-phosphate deaminase n=1 Tax=Magnetospirillum sp. 15-1 TaxID=1979370 RepID=UPI000BBCF79A|nr:glucosamine-6-phosphate deaminase [Magnetospirillum sp. 15-1]
MRVLIEPDAQSVATRAASLVESLVRARPDCVMGLAAGATPLAMYAELTDQRRSLDFSRTTIFGLDEYLGLGAEHPASCARTLRAHFIDRAGIPPSRIHLLDGTAQGDLSAYCAAYEDRITAVGGLDLQILGLGVNGHIGFNEPGCGLAGRTRLVGLRRSTRRTNAPIFAPAEVPDAALTTGIGTILGARRIILLATGPAKADAVVKMIEGPVSALVPASALQLHPDAVVVLDEAAAAGLALAEDYRDEAEILLDRGGITAL